ncbi:MAG: hypothetical protein ACREMO_06795, partial [Gemmatimonadales bacterium]
QHRRTVSPGLNNLIMRCLEKHPADRWQSAAELVPQLDLMATPSGGMTPTGSQPAVSSGTEAAVRQGHPVRVAGLFALASVVVLAIAYLLVQKLGLPYWVLYGAMLLLAAGLPIMLLTGLQERRRALARTTGLVTTTASGPVARWLTWRTALIGGGLGFASLTVVAGGYTAMRLLGIGPVGTLVASGVLKEKEPVLLADFENRTADSTLGPSLTEAFRVDLSQSPTVRLLDAQAIGDALRRMERPATTGFPAALAREVAERMSIKAVVTGQIAPVGSGYVLSASLLSAGDGQVLTAVRETAENAGALLSAIDRLSSKLRERIGESLVTIRGNAPLEQVTTGSLPALKQYTQALRLEEQDRLEEAIPLLEEAVALDTGFAMAYRKLAVTLGNTRASFARQFAAASKAYAHRDRLAELERDLTTAYYYDHFDYDPARAMSAYHSALGVDPDNLVALNNLSIQLVQLRRWVEAESLASRASHLRRGSSFFNNTVTPQVAQGNFDAAHATVERFAQISPGSPALLELRARLAGAQRDYPAAERFVRQLRQEQRSSAVWQARSNFGLFALSAVRGRLAEAGQLTREAMAQDESTGQPDDYVERAARQAVLDLRIRRRPTDALAVLSAALARHPLETMPVLDRPYLWVASVYALAGKPDQAKRLVHEFETGVPEPVRRGILSQHGVAGVIAEAEGRAADAMREYLAWYDGTGGCAVCGLYEMGALYDKTGQPDSALALYQRAVDELALDRLGVDYYTLAPATRRLGELYEAKGDRK